MTELAAAAAVVAMSIDDFAEEDLEQRGFCGAVGAGEVDVGNVEITTEDKENNNVHAATQDVEDAASKVTIALRVLQKATYTPPLT